MTPFLILVCCFLLLLIWNNFFLQNKWSFSYMGRVAMAAMLLFTGWAHFSRTESLISMLPEFFPNKEMVIYLTGLIELFAAGFLFSKRYSRFTSVLLMGFFLAVLPANVIGSIKQVNCGGMTRGVDYLYLRVPLQLLFVFWVFYFGIRINKRRKLSWEKFGKSLSV